MGAGRAQAHWCGDLFTCAIGAVASTPAGPKPAKKVRVVPVVEVIAALGEGVAAGFIVDDPMPGDIVSVPIHSFRFDAKG